MRTPRFPHYINSSLLLFLSNYVSFSLHFLSKNDLTTMSLNSVAPLFDIDGQDDDQPISRIVARHPTYYLPGADLFVTVQRVLFRIHSYFLLRESTHFQRLLSTSPHDLPNIIGTSPTRPLILTDISPSNFAIFLWVFYNPQFGRYITTLQNWTIIHNYSIAWTFPEVRFLAERHLAVSLSYSVPRSSSTIDQLPVDDVDVDDDDDDDVEW